MDKIARLLASIHSIDIDEADKITKSVFDILGCLLIQGEDVHIPGFARFIVKEKQGRMMPGNNKPSEEYKGNAHIVYRGIQTLYSQGFRKQVKSYEK